MTNEALVIHKFSKSGIHCARLNSHYYSLTINTALSASQIGRTWEANFTALFTDNNLFIKPRTLHNAAIRRFVTYDRNCWNLAIYAIMDSQWAVNAARCETTRTSSTILKVIEAEYDLKIYYDSYRSSHLMVIQDLVLSLDLKDGVLSVFNEYFAFDLADPTSLNRFEEFVLKAPAELLALFSSSNVCPWSVHYYLNLYAWRHGLKERF